MIHQFMLIEVAYVNFQNFTNTKLKKLKSKKCSMPKKKTVVISSLNDQISLDDLKINKRIYHKLPNSEF